MTEPKPDLYPIDKADALVVFDLWRAAMKGGQCVTLSPRGVVFLEQLLEWIMADETEQLCNA